MGVIELCKEVPRQVRLVHGEVVEEDSEGLTVESGGELTQEGLKLLGLDFLGVDRIVY